MTATGRPAPADRPRTPRPPAPARPPQGGLLLVDKPAGRTSHDVVGRVRWLLGTRRVGHAGTLDPMATGLLLVAVDRATRLLGHLALTDKQYLATVRLGRATDTDDADGTVLPPDDPAAVAAALRVVTDAQLTAGTAALTGALLQVPSSVSAIKVAGRRAYDRVRAGETVELAARPVTVHRFQIVAPPRRLTLPAAGVSATGGTEPVEVIDLDVVVDCTTGTYVRALARDLGRALGVGGHLTALRRTRVGPFTLDGAASVFDPAVPGPDDPDVADGSLGRALVASMLTPEQVARTTFPVRVLTAHEAAGLRHGRPVTPTGRAGTVAALLPTTPDGSSPTRGSGTAQAGEQLIALLADSDGAARSVLGWAAG
ncbi:tRNA pseudouridine(55) synthase TruB [Nakamurella leprariae]|uniref:tRNA pseudouridine synthase B n=1 Tax=Nakamurella leprariae TaxID=2803911 RepID=A0A939C074_9ACTN|nr:tRNA pseudouridine(55) synthase TruB [Nakamurella leprariae]MBM9465882.1 tRNA pseudouridine(55) synthase TruB [Nakamurella leprariae]